MGDGLYRWAKSRRAKRNVLLAILWIAMAAGVFSLREILLPFVLAALIAYVIEPLVRWLASKDIRGRRVPRFAAVIGIYLGIAATIWLVAAFFLPQVYREVARLARDGAAFVNGLDEAEIDRLATRAEDGLRRLRLPVDLVTGNASEDEVEPEGEGKAQRNPENDPGVLLVDGPLEVDVVTGVPLTGEPAHDAGKLTLDKGESTALPLFTINLRQVAKESVKRAALLSSQKVAEIFSQLRLIVGGIAGVFFSFVVVLMLTAFILMDTERIKRFFFSIVPVEDRATFDTLLERIDRGLSGVVRGQLTICLVNGTLTLVGLLLLQVKFAFVLATLAAVFSLVPVFGSIMSTIPIVLVAVTSGFWTGVLSLVWILVIHFLEANVLNPKILGDSARIHPVMVVLALVAGEHFFGIAGALLAVPVMSIMLTLFRFLLGRAHGLDDERNAPVPVLRARRRQPRIRSEPMNGG